MRKNKAQIWVETVLYTIVILSIIAIVLSFAIPKIDEGRDRLVIEQTIDALKTFDESIYDAAKQNGNIRIIEINLKRGNLYFDMANDNITINIQGLKSVYSEPGVPIKNGNIELLFIKGQKMNEINLTLSYGLNLTYEGSDNSIKISSASLPYTFSIESIFDGSKSYIDITELI
jgi:type II secretory pathway pseudopilin PulG